MGRDNEHNRGQRLLIIITLVFLLPKAVAAACWLIPGVFRIADLVEIVVALVLVLLLFKGSLWARGVLTVSLFLGGWIEAMTLAAFARGDYGLSSRVNVAVIVLLAVTAAAQLVAAWLLFWSRDIDALME